MGAAQKSLSVGAVSRDDMVTGFSSNGRVGVKISGTTTDLLKPDVVAPGGSFWTGQMIAADTNDRDLDKPTKDNDYTLMAGTSMATPVVSGEAALVIDALTDYDKKDENDWKGPDSDTWNGVDDDGDCRIDNDFGEWKFTEQEALSVKRVILMTTHEVQKGEKGTSHNEENKPPLDRGGKDRREGYGMVNADAAIQAVTEEMTCCKDNGTLGSAQNLPTDRKVWAKYIELFSEAEYSFKLEGNAGDFDLYLYNVHYKDLATGDTRNRFDIGEPQIIKSKTGAGSNHEFKVRLKDASQKAPRRGIYYVAVKWVSGHGDFTLEVTKKTNWTVMVYMGAEHFDKEAQDAINEMEKIGSDGNMNIIVMVDYSNLENLKGTEYDHPNSSVSQNTVYAHYIRCDKKEDLITSPVCGKWEEMNMGDPKTLSDFIKNVTKCYPAKHYLLDIWGQGYGWKGVIRDTNTFLGTDLHNDTLYMGELKKALSDGGQYFDIIGFDAGFMGMVEVAKQVYPFAQVMVGSEESMNPEGWPYDDVLEWLRDNSDKTYWEFSSAIVNAFHMYYTVDDPDPLHTLSAVNLATDFDTLVKGKINTFADDMLGDGSLDEWGLEDYNFGFGKHFDPNDNVQIRVKSDLALSERYQDGNYIDLRDFMTYIRDNPGIPAPYKKEAPAIVDLLRKNGDIILAEEHGSAHPKSTGLSIYFPAYQTRYENPFGSVTNDPFDDPWPSCAEDGGTPENPKNLTLYAYDYSTEWGTSPYKPFGAKPPHPLEETSDFDFRQVTLWDEFLHRYYKPVADAGEDQVVFTEGLTATVTLDGSGSSDADGKVQLWAWDLDATLDEPSGTQMIPGNDDADADEKDETIDDFNIEGMKVDVQLPIGVHTITLTVWDDHFNEPDTHKDYYNSTNETHMWQRKTDQDQVTVIVLGKIKTIGDPEVIRGEDSFVTSSTPFNIDDHLGEYPGTVRNYYRIWYDDTWTDWMDYTGPFTLEGECEHRIEFYGETDWMDETIRSPTFKNIHYVDDSPPRITPDPIGPKYDDFLKNTTVINLTGEDRGTEPCIVGLDKINYRTWFNGSWSEWLRYAENLTLDFEGMYHMEYYGVDLLNNTEDIQNMTYIVDLTAPIVTKMISEPKAYDGLWVRTNTTFSLAATDRDAEGGSDGVGVDKIFYRIWHGGSWSDWITYAGEFKLDSEGLHYLEYYAVDHLGNAADIHNQTHYADDTPPTTYKTIGEPNFKDGLWVTSDSGFTLESDDLTGVGTQGAYYRLWHNDSWTDWIMYEEIFSLEEEGSYTIEFLSVDLLGNTESVISQDHSVDNTAPNMTEEVGEPNWEDSYYVSKETPIWVNASDENAEGKNGSLVEYIYYEIWWDSDDDGDVDTMVDNETVMDRTVELVLRDWGVNRIYFYAVDYIGNVAETEYRQHELV